MTKVSMAPEDMAVGGGLFDDGDVTVESARWGPWDYRGTRPPVTALNVIFTPDDPEAEKFSEHYTCGKSFVESADGLYLELAPGAKSSMLNKSSGAGFFLAQLQTPGTKDGPAKGTKGAGYIGGVELSEDMSKLEGLKGRVRRLPKPTQSNADASTLCFVSVSGNTQAPVVDDSALRAFVMQALADGPVSAAKVKAAVFAGVQGSGALSAAEKNAMLKRSSEAAFLSNLEAPWTFDGTTLTIK